MSSSRTHSVDNHVGGRLRLRRKVMGWSQKKLGDAVGISFQQVQKYESGANRIGASRLFEFAELLKMDVSFYFDGLSARETEMPVIPDTETLLTAFCLQAIRDSDLKKAISDLIRAVSATGQDTNLFD